MLFKWYYVFAFYLSFFMINPDIDLLFGIAEHRSFITHSVIFPFGIYWAFHDFVNMETAKIFGLIIFTPVLIHLLCDYQIGDILDIPSNEEEERLKKELEKEGKSFEKGKGSWRISWNFLSFRIRIKERKSKRIGFRHKRMSKEWSIVWVSCNIIFIILYIGWIWGVQYSNLFNLF